MNDMHLKGRLRGYDIKSVGDLLVLTIGQQSEGTQLQMKMTAAGARRLAADLMASAVEHEAEKN